MKGVVVVDPTFAHHFIRKAVLHAQYQETTELGEKIAWERKKLRELQEKRAWMDKTTNYLTEILFTVFMVASLPVLGLWVIRMLTEVLFGACQRNCIGIDALEFFQEMPAWDGPHDILRRFWAFEAYFIQHGLLRAIPITGSR